jgi:protochlorophyllide reductase
MIRPSIASLTALCPQSRPTAVGPGAIAVSSHLQKRLKLLKIYRMLCLSSRCSSKAIRPSIVPIQLPKSLLARRSHVSYANTTGVPAPSQQISSDSPSLDRRQLMMGMGVALGINMWLEDQPATAAMQQLISSSDDKDVKTVIITGSNSGIGRASALQLAATRKYRIVLACRTQAKADMAAKELQEELEALISKTSIADGIKSPSSSSSSSSVFIPMECDLSSFASVRAFADQFHQSGLKLDVLALNAGVQFAGSEVVQRSVDGYELTLATNHLGHFLLTNLLLPDLEASSSSSPSSPRIVVTASEVHDPASPGGSVGNGAHLGLYPFPGLDSSTRTAMIDGGDWDADKAYKDTKLCNVLFTKELSERLKKTGSKVTVNSFGPGLITRSGFFRSQNPLFVGVFDFATNDLFKVAETVEGGGRCLTYMIASPSLEGKSGVYYNNGIAGYGGHSFEESITSQESMDEKEARQLWEASSVAVGLA